MPAQISDGATAFAALRALSRLVGGGALGSCGLVLQKFSTSRQRQLLPGGCRRFARLEDPWSPRRSREIAAALLIFWDDISSTSDVASQTASRVSAQSATLSLTTHSSASEAFRGPPAIA